MSGEAYVNIWETVYTNCFEAKEDFARSYLGLIRASMAGKQVSTTQGNAQFITD